MKNLLLVFAAILPLLSFAQNKNKDFNFKVYSSYESYVSNEYQLDDPFFNNLLIEKHTSFGDISVGFPFSSEFFGQEISIAAVKFKTNKYQEIEFDDKDRSIFHSSSLKDESKNFLFKGMYELFLINHSKKKLRPQFGFGIESFLIYSEAYPMLPTVFPNISLSLGATLYFVPRLLYSLTENLYLDLNVPFGISQFIWNQETNLDPSLTLKEQRQRQSDFDFLNNTFQIRFGIGVRI